MGRFEQPCKQAPIVENVGIHVENRLAGREHLAQRPQGEQAAGPVVRVKPGADQVGRADRGELALDLLGAMTDHQGDVDQPELHQDVEMTPEQAVAFETQQGLGRPIAGRVEPVADPRRQHGDFHEVSLPASCLAS